MGQLRKRGDIWWIRYYRNGRRYEESARSASWETARDLLRKREGAVADGVAISAKIGQVRFEEAAQDLVTDYTVNKKRTLVDLERRIADHLTPWFRGRRLTTIGTADVRLYVKYRQEQGAANASINLELANLKRMFTLAIQAGKVLQRPYIPMLKEDNVRKGFFERAQFEAVRARLQAPLDDAVTLAYYTGWRMASEVLPLQWHQIDRRAGVIRLEPGTTKNREGRTFQYRELVEVKAAVEALWARHEALEGKGIITPFVFCRGGGQAIKSFYTRWTHACEAAGCPGRIPHDMRRTAVRNLNRAGVPETVAMKITGHKTRSVFDRYDITSEEDLVEAARKLQAMMTGTIAGTIDEKQPIAMSAAFGRKSRRGRGLMSGDRGGDRTRGPRIKSWQGSVSVQHELRPGVAFNVGYFRTSYGNLRATDNQDVVPADFSQYSVKAPTNAQLPGGGGGVISGLYDLSPAKFGQVHNLVTLASHYGKQTDVFTGVDATLGARFGRGGLVQGGLSTGRQVTDACFVVDSPQQMYLCHNTPLWSAGTQVKVADPLF